MYECGCKFSNVLKNYFVLLSDTKVILLFETCKYICNYFQSFFTSIRKNYFVISRFIIAFLITLQRYELLFNLQIYLQFISRESVFFNICLARNCIIYCEMK